MTQLPKFNNQKLFNQAFTHRSFLNETKQKLESNERLEFLGDSILSFVVSQYLYNTYPGANEGILTNLRSMLVNTQTLYQIAKQLDFGNKLILSKGEEEGRGRENKTILENTFEAFIGALFLDQGIGQATTFIKEVLLSQEKTLVAGKQLKDPKSLLQEKVQSKKYNSPLYKVVHEEGPSHSKIFTISVFIDNQCFGQGKGHTKQQAEEEAASQALEKIGK